MLKTICKDAFVTVSGGGVSYSVYKGTTCRTCAESEPLGQGEYEAGGFPQYGNATDRGTGGMGKRYYIGDHWYFEFPHLKDIYASTSNLNVMEKSSLEYALQTITKRPADFSKVYQKLLATKKLIKFQINPKAISNAQYNKDNISIEFKDSYVIDGDKLMEELLHAAQHLVYYGEAMDNKYKDYEFEVKCFWDCSYWIAYIYDGLDYPAPMYYATITDSSILSDYEPFIEKIYQAGFFSRTNLATYNSIADKWKGYNGMHISNFTPKMILDILGRARPPLKQ